MAEAALARRMNSPTRHPFPFDRHDGPASNSPSRARNAGVSKAVCPQAAQSTLTKSPSPRFSILAEYNGTIFAPDVLCSFYNTITTRAVSSIRQPHLDEVP
jgi:hypothetical protein